LVELEREIFFVGRGLISGMLRVCVRTTYIEDYNRNYNLYDLQ